MMGLAHRGWRLHDPRHHLLHTLREGAGYHSNCDDGPTKDELIELGWPTWHGEREQLFHLGFDPGEMRNLIGDPRWADVAGEMRGRLDRWMRESDDPLLDGPVPLPEGAWVNEPSQVSAAEPPGVIA